MDANTLRWVFLDYFAAQGHAIIPGAPLVPANDPAALFTMAGMQPLVPFLRGAPHPAGRRLANVQPCLRPADLAAVGNDGHLTLFEMLGNWSLGAYWKAEAIQSSYTFLTERLGLDPGRLYATCSAGDAERSRDEESAAAWRSVGLAADHIYFLPLVYNWWEPASGTGPCGPDTEIFYDLDPGAPLLFNPQRFFEIWNNVFMDSDRQADGRYLPLAQRNVDAGMGLERMLAVLQGVASPYETDLFAPAVAHLRVLAPDPRPGALRIVADHLRAAVFILAEGFCPGEDAQPAVLRRLLHRALHFGAEMGVAGPFLVGVAETIIAAMSTAYPELARQHDWICAALDGEETAYRRAFQDGELRPVL